MGARLSRPRGPDGINESSRPVKEPPPSTSKQPFPRHINGRTVAAPIAAFTMACILFVYARTSIRAAKANAQRHWDADSGGEGLSLLNEHRRRHGLDKRVEGGGGGTVRELAGEVKGQLLGKKEDGVKKGGNVGGAGRSEEEEKLRALKGVRSVRRKDEDS